MTGLFVMLALLAWLLYCFIFQSGEKHGVAGTTVYYEITTDANWRGELNPLAMRDVAQALETAGLDEGLSEELPAIGERQ